MQRRRLWPLLLVVIAVALPSGAVASASDEPNFLIVKDTSIAGFPRDGHLARAFAIFGQPVSRVADWETCTLRWPRYGMTMQTWFSTGGEDPCGPDATHVWTRVTDRRWHTSAGLRIGDKLFRLRALYPRARSYGVKPGTWYLTRRKIAGVIFPGLEAQVKGGRVVSFTIHGPHHL